MPTLLILVPLLGIIILNLPFRNVMKKVVFEFCAALLIIEILLAIFHHPNLLGQHKDPFESFFTLSFAVDQLTFIMLICIGIVSLSTLFAAKYTIGNDGEKLFNFVNLLIIATIGMNGIVMVKDIFTLYVFLEITAVSSFILISFNREKNALEGAFKYILLSAVATIFMLTSIALLVLISGSTSFSAISDSIKSSPNNSIAVFSMGIFICGLFIKSGLVPFHGWLPDAYSAAPASVSVLLAGIVTKVSGVYILIRLVSSVFILSEPIKNTLLLVGAVSILVGAFAAIGQSDFKRMLAYSSISQVGYIIIGLGTGTVLGILGAVFHLFNHSMFKSLLFLNSAAVEKQTGTRDMNKLGGLSCKMPVTGATSVVALLSVSGIPPLSGFWSKIIIIIALWQSSHYAYSVIAVLASIVTLTYLLSMQRRVFFGKLIDDLEGVKEVQFGFAMIAILLAIITVGTGVFFPFVFNELIVPVKEILISVVH